MITIITILKKQKVGTIKLTEFADIKQNEHNLHISKNTFNMTDTPANMTVNIINDSSTFTEPLIQLQNSTGIITTYAQSGIDADGHDCFILDNKERFMKQRNPFSFQVTELNDGDFIELNYPFVFFQNITVKILNFF